MEISDVELHDPNEVEKDAQVDDKGEKTENDYLLARGKSRRVIKPPQKLGYADLIT